MKYVFSNGKTLEVRDIGDVIYKMTLRSDAPLPIVAKEIMSDNDTRDLLRNLKETGYYNGEKT